MRIKMPSNATTTMAMIPTMVSTGWEFFLTITTGGSTFCGTIASSTGCPQCGHATALSDTSLPHSVQNLSANRSPLTRRAG